MNRSFCRQVLDCGDGVREVTALALAALKMPKRAANTAIAHQSGDSEDSVAAVQDARAPTCAALGSWSQCALGRPWRLSLSSIELRCRADRAIVGGLLLSDRGLRGKLRRSR